MAMSKKKKILVIAGCVAGGLVLLLAAAYNVALSSSVICSRWLPMAGRMTNSTMTASEVKLSLFGNSLEVRDFVYASPSGIEVRVDSLQTKIAFIKAISKDIRVNGLALKGVHAKIRPVRKKAIPPAAGTPVAAVTPATGVNRPAANENTAVPLIEDFQIPESILGWKALPFKIALKDVALQDITVDYADEAGEMDFKYVINSLSLNRVTPGMTTEITLDSFLTGSLKKQGVEIRSLPLFLSFKTLLGDALFPETFDLAVNLYDTENRSAVFVWSAYPGQQIVPGVVRLAVRGKKVSAKWELEELLGVLGKSSLKASGSLEPRLNNASFVWTLKGYPSQLPQPLPSVMKKSGMELSYVEENGKITFLNGKLDYSDIISATGFKLDEKGTAVGDFRGTLNYIAFADLPEGAVGLSNAVVDVSEGESKLITLKSTAPLVFYKGRKGFFPDPQMAPNLRFSLREMALSKLNMFLKGKRFRNGAAELNAVLETDQQRNILLTANAQVKEKLKGRAAADLAVNARLDLRNKTSPDTIRISSANLDVPVLQEIFKLEDTGAVQAQAPAPQTSVPQNKDADAKKIASGPAVQAKDSAQPRTPSSPADKLPSFVREQNVNLTLDLKKIHYADGVDFALTGDISFKDLTVAAKNLLVLINGTKFPLNAEVNLATEQLKIGGSTAALNAAPLVNSFLKQKKTAALTVDSLKFDIRTKGFTPDSVRKNLNGSFVLNASNIAVPLELDQSSDLLKVIMIPLKSIPALLEMLGGSELRNLAVEKTQGLNNVLSGAADLRFTTASLDTSFLNGVVTLKDLTLTGDLILSETLLGTVNLVNNEIDLKTRTGLELITIPMNFKGTINSPKPDYASAVTDFLKVNATATLQKSVDKLLDRALDSGKKSTGENTLQKEEKILDKAIDKGVQKGLERLNKWLNK